MALTSDVHRQQAVGYRDSAYEGVAFASRRSSALSDEFTRLQIQIAAMLFAFSGLFLGFFGNAPALSMRIAFAAALFSLVASLVAGLIHLKRKEYFWDNAVKDRGLRFTKWQETIDREGNVEEAYAFLTGLSHAMTGVKSFPFWTWIAQTTFLGLAVAILFVLAILFLFS